MEHGWSIPQDAGEFFRSLEKRLTRLERAQGGSGLDVLGLLGPGIAAQAVQIVDWSERDATLNGFYHSVPGSVNSPDSNLSWTGQVIAKDDGTGMQQVWNTDGPSTLYWMRTYAPTVAEDGNVVFSEWKRFATATGLIGEDELDQDIIDAINEGGGPPPAPVEPVYTLRGFPRGIMVQIMNGKPGWTYTYTITDHTDDESPDITASFPPTTQHIFYTEFMPDGTPLDPTSDGYSFQVKAENESGEATTTESPVQPLVLNDDSTVAELAVGKLIAGDFTGAFGLFGSLQVGVGITISDAGGIEIQTPLGVMQLPTDGSSPVFKGEAEFDAAVILGNFKLQGRAETGNANEIAKGGVLELASALSPPKSPPTLTATHPTHTIHGGFSPRGLAKHEARTNRYLGTESLFSGGIVALAKDGNGDYVHALENFSLSGSPGLNRTEIQSAVGGLAFNASNGNLYVLCQTDEPIPDTYYGKWYVYQLSWTGSGNNWTFVRRWEYTPGNDFLGGYSSKFPQIAYDAVNGEVVIAQAAAGSGEMWVSRYGPTGTFIGRGRLFQQDGTTRFVRNRHVTGFVCSDVPDGENCYYLTFDYGDGVFVFGAVSSTNPRVRVPGFEFTMPSDLAIALAWQEGGFHTRHNLEGTKEGTLGGAHRVHDYSNITNQSVYAAQTWRRADGTGPDFAQYETTISPVRIEAAFPRRACLLLTSSVIPYDGTDSDTANSVTFYAGHTSDIRRQTVPGTVTSETSVAVSYTELETLTGTPPLATDRPFPDALPAIVRSSGENLDNEKTILLTGSGYGRTGPYEWDEDGRSTETMIQLTPTMSGVSGHSFYIKQIAPDTIAVSGYLDVDDTNTTRRDTGMRIPAGWEPPDEVIVSSAQFGGSGVYRYIFGANGVIEFQQTVGNNNPYEGITAIWFTR